MGKEVIKTAKERNHKIVDIFDIDNKKQLSKENLKKADVVFEFTQPDAAFKNVSLCFDAAVPCISGTTGWLNKLEEIKKRCKKEQKAFFYASNFSIGVNILFKLNSFLSKIMNNYPNYDVSISESHHINKKDAPSGTAVQIANEIINNISRKTNWSLKDKSAKNILVSAHRGGDIPGIHTIKYESDIDYLQIKHSAKNRKGLALGAVLAAEFIKNKKGFFTMDDLLKF